MVFEEDPIISNTYYIEDGASEEVRISYEKLRLESQDLLHLKPAGFNNLEGVQIDDNSLNKI